MKIFGAPTISRAKGCLAANRLRSSSTEYTATLMSRFSRRFAATSTEDTARLEMSPTIIRSTSLESLSSPRATEP